MTRRCYDDSCESAHCARCDTHYAGGNGGLCQDCMMIEEDEKNAFLQAEYNRQIKEQKG
jgi:hypothetical protein